MSYPCSYNSMGVSLTPPPTPQTSRKRGRDDYEKINILKRAQFHQIHSQEHLNTVEMMMQASRQNKYVSEPDIQESEGYHNGEETQEKMALQKPYWPVISRVRES